ncbi:MAG: type II toxin-antitoxin system RelE/ParE family toxin [Terracidiphilus sp.]|jgi:plasmid stabilization system protein ParE
MMHSVVYAPEAEAQLVAIYFHIAAAASPEIAARYTDAIVKQCESLKTFPMRGALRNDIRSGLRVFGFRRRVSIAFEVTADVVTILGIFYGGQDFEAAFKE